MKISAHKIPLLILFSLALILMSAQAQAQAQGQASNQGTLTPRPDIMPFHPALVGFMHLRFPYTLIHFYDSREPISKEHEDFMIQLYNELPAHYPGIKLAKFDIKTNDTALELYKVTEKNSLQFFIKGDSMPHTYTGDLTTEDLVDWLKYRLVEKVKELNSNYMANELVTTMDLTLIYFGSIYSESFTAFLGAMTAFNDPNTSFAHTNDMSMRFEFGLDEESEAIILFRNHDEERNGFMGPFTVESIKNFTKIYRYPAVMTYTKQARIRLQTMREDAIVLFINQDEEGERLVEIFSSLAPEYREKIIFLYTESNESFGHSVAAYINKEKTDYPMVMIISGQNMLRYVLDRDITEKNLRVFLNNFFEGNLKQYLRSEPKPAEEYEKGVKVLVGNNYWRTVKDTTKDVLVAFYSPDCPYSDDLFQSYPLLARRLKNTTDIVVAKINNDLNDLDGLNVLSVPTIYFYPRGRKMRPIIQNRSTYKVIVEMLKKHATAKIPDNMFQFNKTNNFANKLTGV